MSFAKGAAEPLRVALVAYRGNPRSGGQGVYIRFLSRELARLGHEVTVFSGPPWPTVDEAEGVHLVKVPSLDLYREPDPFRLPKPSRDPFRGGPPGGRDHDDRRFPRASNVQLEG